MRQRLASEQHGFSLPEMMTTIVIMIVVLFSLYGIFDMSIRIFRYGNDQTEAIENARLGLQKMEREIRAAYPVHGPTSIGANRYRFFNANGSNPPSGAAWPTATQITFGNELGSPGDRLIRCPSATSCEYITYKLVGSTLRRVNLVDGSDVGVTGAPVVEFVRPNGLQFRYLTLNGTVINPASPGAYTTRDIGRVQITLEIEVRGRSKVLTTTVDLRNRGNLSS